MALRQWYFGVAVATAALIPLSANAVTVMNLPASGNFVANDTLTIDYAGVEALNGTIGSGLNGGSCATVGSSPTGCKEIGYAVGNISSLTDSGGVVWSSGVSSAANPSGYFMSFILYGTADLSDVTSGTNTKNDSTGANAAAQTATYSSNKSASTTVSLTGAENGKIHLDLYYMPASEKPCFTAGCTLAGSRVEVASTDRTGFGTVHGISDAAGGGLFAQLTFVPGVLPTNAIDGPTNGAVTLSGNFDTSGTTGGKSGAYATCDVSGATTPPGCSNFQAVTETTMDGEGTGNIGDPTYASSLVNAFLANQIGFSTTGQSAAGWFFAVHDPVTAVTPVPEPASLALLGSGLAFLGVAISRRRRRTTSA